MNKNLSLVAVVLTSIVFISSLGESGPKELFGMSYNIWFFRLGWLVIAISAFLNYKKTRSEKK